MTNQAPGVYTTITAAPPSPNAGTVTGTWFVTGEAYQGPVGDAVPITSMTDYAKYLGPRVSYGSLFDSLDEFFHDGGVLAYASRVVGPGAASAAYSALDRNESPVATLTFTAVGAGAWGNAVSLIIADGSASDSYTVQVLNNGVIAATSPNLFSPSDAVTWFAAQNSWEILVTVANAASTTPSPDNNPATGTFALSGGSDDTSGVTDTQWTNALTAFTVDLGPGQVSAPGHTTTAGYEALSAHAQANNRVAILDVADSPTASTLVAQAQAVQGGVADASFDGMFAPWIIIPGIFSSNPGSASPIPSRVVPPSALACALMARNDQTNTANNPAAGPNGVSTYAIGVTQQYSDDDRATLNAAGIDVVRSIRSSITVYGYRSLSLDPNWTFLNNVRFRMQVEEDFSEIGDSFLFSQIDGKGQLFANLNGALAGKCQQYWMDGSLYGATAADAFQVNTGPQVNTPATITAGQINAQVLLRMSPFGEYVQINVVKYLPNAVLPAA